MIVRREPVCNFLSAPLSKLAPEASNQEEQAGGLCRWNVTCRSTALDGSEWGWFGI